MTLDEAIKHCEEKADEIRKANEEMPIDCKLSEDLCECANEHEQLAEWLKDYKRLLEDRPQGEWIIDGHHIRCNRCYEYICNTDREGNEIPDNFCPNCGAKMGRSEEE